MKTFISDLYSSNIFELRFCVMYCTGTLVRSDYRHEYHLHFTAEQTKARRCFNCFPKDTKPINWELEPEARVSLSSVTFLLLKKN